MTALSTARSGSLTRPASRTPAVPKLRYIVVVLAGIFSILGIQLLLSIAVSGAAYEIAGLKGEVRKSQQELQVVAEDISALTAPNTLAGLANALGMVADNNPAYLRLSSGEVVGEAYPADGSSSLLLYPVTAGTEAPNRPAIVEHVMQTVSLAVATDASGGEAAQEVDTTAQASETPAVTPVSNPVTAEPKPRFGGTIPSPQTR